MCALNSSGIGVLNRFVSNLSSVSAFLRFAFGPAFFLRDPFDAADVWHLLLHFERGQVRAQRLVQFFRQNHHPVKELRSGAGRGQETCAQQPVN